MAMSRDRVRFFVSATIASKSAVREAFREAMGTSLPVVCDEVEVICRPSQFARFLIRREQLGGVNEFKALRAELFTPERENTKLIDATKNPNTMWRET